MATAVKLDAPRRTPTTAEELLAWPDDQPGEIVDGVFVPKYRDGEVTGTGFAHGIVSIEIALLLGAHVKAGRLGRVLAAETAFRLRRNPDVVRCPDVAFVAAARLTAGIPRGAFEGAPDLAVEVLSPTNTVPEMNRKLVDYLRYGVRSVWVIDPDARTVAVHPAGALPRWHQGDDVLDGGDVLPGFSVVTSAVFADLDPTA